MLRLCLGSYCPNALATVWGWGQWHGYAGTGRVTCLGHAACLVLPHFSEEGGGLCKSLLLAQGSQHPA